MENSYGVLDTITATAAWIWQPIAGKRPPPDLPPPKDSDLVWEAYATCRRDPTKRGASSGRPRFGTEASAHTGCPVAKVFCGTLIAMLLRPPGTQHVPPPRHGFITSVPGSKLDRAWSLRVDVPYHPGASTTTR